METFPDYIELTLVYKIEEDDNEYYTEKVYAKKIDAYYELTGIPAFAKNIAYGDVVKVELEDGVFHFEKLIKESGHSVIHIVIFDPNKRNKIISTLQNFGCSVNDHIADNYLAIDIPSVIQYSGIQLFLKQEQLANCIDYQEACISKIHRQVSN